MSSRALRRLQKQQEEQKALQQAQEAEQSSEDEVAAPAKSKLKQSAFAFLNDAGGENENDENDDDVEPAIAAENNAVPVKPAKPINDGTSTPKSTKKNKKKKKNKSDKTTENTDDDDIDAVLASLAQAKGQPESTTGPSTKDEIYSLLSVDSQHLHAINEMRRLFGREALDDRPRQPEPNPRRRGQRMQPQQEGRGFPAVSLKRNIFVQGKEEWPRATTGGLGMEMVSKDPSTGVTEYRFVHSTAYQETQRQYEIAVASMDPQRLVVLLQQNPYHIATLLQVSEIMKHDRQHTEAGDVLERALFAFGRTVHSTFGAAMVAGKARLSFDRPENREFFLACWRYIQDLSMRSTWRTVYEWAKLLYGIAPESDPYAMGLVLDKYALRANQAGQYLRLEEGREYNVDVFTPWGGDPRRNAFSVALCHLRMDDRDKAREMLKYAVEEDLSTAHALCKALEIEPMPPALWAHHEAPNASTALLSAMYTTRAKDLWNTPDAKSLLEEVARALPRDVKTSAEDEEPDAISTPVARHVYLTENESFLRLLAACTLLDGSDPRDAGDRPMQDPFPPTATEIRSYDPRPAGGVAPGGARGIPPSIRAALGRLPPEQMEAMMQELARMQMGGDGEGGQGVEWSDGDESDEDLA